jgi:trehalose 6-phosphate synthase/phosphatase
MRQRIERYDVSRWAGDFLDRLQGTAKETGIAVPPPLGDEKAELVSDFRKSQRRLLFLDYNGTLIPFARTPQKAQPDKPLLSLLEKLAGDPKNEVVLISGRDRATLEEWFGSVNVGLVAEHGVWTRKKGGGWEKCHGLTDNWKKGIRKVLDMAVDRILGSLVEEKDYSLAWHYREAVPGTSESLVREVSSDLLNLTANSPLRVLEGDKVVEVKSAYLNKGLAALKWTTAQPDFILALGDDVTDEDTFTMLPEGAWSVKVRPGTSAARSTLESPEQVRILLEELAGKSSE